MTETLESWAQRLGGWKLSSGSALLGGAYLIYFLVACPIAWWTAGQLGLVAAGLATVVCLLSGWLALLVTTLLVSPGKSAAHVLVGTAIRMSLPLIVCLVVIQREPALTAAGFAWYLIGAYMLGLLMETVLAVGQLNIQEKH